MKLIKALLIVSITILTIMSVLALVSVHWALGQKEFLISPTGIENYLSAFGNYKALFTGTVATAAAYFGLQRLKAAVDANVQKTKQDRFLEWRSVLDNLFNQIEKNDPYMKQEFTRIRYKFYERLYDLDFNIKTQAQLKPVFDNVFQDLVSFFELQNNTRIGMGGIYPEKDYSYSFENFRYLFLNSVDRVYDNIVPDLKSLYVNFLPKDRHIDSKLYHIALLNYRRN